MPKVSVIIASYNHEAYVAECLESVLTQTFQDFEIVVTDDGSRDGTVAAISAFDDPRINLVAFPQNRGACVAMNACLDRAQAPYVAVLNSDDVWEPDKLDRQVRFLDSHPDMAAVFTYPRLVNEHGAAFSDSDHKDFSVFFVENRSRQAWLRHFFYAGNCLCHPTLMMRRSAYDVLGPYDERLAQVPDLDMWIRLALRFDFHVLPDQLTRFRIRDNAANASAARPDAIVRDTWERGRLLAHYRSLDPATFAAVFEEPTPPHNVDLALARKACAVPHPAYQAFGLDLWHETLPRSGSDGVADLIAETGQRDIFCRLPPPRPPQPDPAPPAFLRRVARAVRRRLFPGRFGGPS